MSTTKGQKKIILSASLIIILFVLLWIFLYIPAKNTLRNIKKELPQVEKKIHTLETIIGKNAGLEKGVAALQKQFKELDTKFPASEEKTIRLLSNTAYKLGIDVISIKPEPAVLLLDENENEIKIDNKICKKLSIAMNVYSTYRELGNFLHSLREDIPSLLTIENVTVAKGEKRDNLKADIHLTMYLLVGERK